MGIWSGERKGWGAKRSSRVITPRTATVGDLASLEMQGGQTIIEEYDLLGYTNATNAQHAAARRLAARSFPLAAFELETNRVAYGLRPGMPFVLSLPKQGIGPLIARVRSIKGGSLTAGTIVIEAQEDLFAATWLGTSLPPSSGWEEPASEVPALVSQAAIQAPYEMVKELPAGASQQALIMAIHGIGGVSNAYDAFLQKPDLSWYPPTRVAVFTPAAVLYSDIDELSDTIIVAAGTDLSRIAFASPSAFAAGSNLLWIQRTDGLEEFVAFQNVSGTSVLTLTNLARGCLDTAPTAFTAGVRVWFVSYGYAVVSLLEPVPPDTTRENTIRMQPFNRTGRYPFDDCDDSVLDASTPHRAQKVYCPTAVTFNGESYPEEIEGELTVAWSHRNRLGTWSYANAGATTEREAGTEYDILVYGENDTLVHTESGLTGTSWTYLEADEISESGLGRLNNHLRVIVRTYGDSREHQAIREIEWEFDRDIEE